MNNILTLTGDPPSTGDHPDARPVFETDSTGLIRIAATLNSGFDMTGHPLDCPTRFYIGTTGNPGADDLDAELRRLEGKKTPALSSSRPSPSTTWRGRKNTSVARRASASPSSSACSPQEL